MYEKVYSLIDSYRDEFVQMLSSWIQIPSVKDAPAPGAPFGKEIEKMMEKAVEDAQKLGFKTRTFDGYACDVTLGDEEKEMIAVLAHLDVVPAGDGWKVPPFAAVIEGDRMYGRGTNDDKGPALAGLFAMRAIREAGIPLKKSIRLILGGDEESGWEDMAWYKDHTTMPDVGFSPDASFPLINTEKGMVHMFMKAPVSSEGLQVLELHTGERVNVIPGESVAMVSGDASTVAAVEQFAEESGLNVEAELTEKGVKISAHGIPGHSAYPEACRNANGMMLLTLKALGVQGAFLELANAYPMEYDGTALGIACNDAVSGSLTCNMGILHLDDGIVTASFDCRCPLCADLESIAVSIKAHLPSFVAESFSTKKPHHVPAESELVTGLLAAYEEMTGLKGEAQSTGGGTYAKVLKSGVAFGSAFPDDEDLAHQAGEYITISKMITATKIYANALLRLCAE